MQLKLLMILVINFGGTASLETEVISTTTGKVQGDIERSRVPGKSVQKFINIPYAEPPVGELRFAKPVPKKPWNGTLRNSNVSVTCWQQVLEDDKRISLTEDCLILNIWTPYPQEANKSVMIWIHGGAYVHGHSGAYLGHNFVAVGDVVLVTINYRLSALGFLSTGDHRIKGNFGLFDQRLAMKWVKDNIASFGGNPQSITIFGESSGASSASAHTLSKDSWPVFDRAILQSGNMIMPWAKTSKSGSKTALRVLLQQVNCTDDENLLECLRTNVSERDLEKIYTSKPFILEKVFFGFSPVVDGDFLTDEPQKLLEAGEVKNNAVIIGVTKDEAFFAVQDLLQISRNISFIKAQFQELLKSQLPNASATVYDQATELYQPECLPSFVEAVKPMIAIITDHSYLCPTTKEAKFRSQILNSTNVYVYRYSYVSIIPPVPLEFIYPRGTFGFAAHVYDIPSVFGFPIKDPKYPPEHQILSLRMILYWTNFAKNGDPNVGNTTLPIVIGGINSLPKWPKFTNSSREFLDMESLSRMIVGKRLRETYCDFLDDPEGFTRRANQRTPATTERQPTFTVKATTRTTSTAVKHIAQVALMVVTLLPIINQTF